MIIHVGCGRNIALQIDMWGQGLMSSTEEDSDSMNGIFRIDWTNPIMEIHFGYNVSKSDIRRVRAYKLDFIQCIWRVHKGMVTL
jgi:hypothetical protein